MTALIRFASDDMFDLFLRKDTHYKGEVVEHSNDKIKLKTSGGDIIEATFLRDGIWLKPGTEVVFSGSGQLLEYVQR